MNCESAKEKMADWLNSGMTETEQREWDLHATGCPECTEEWKSLRHVWQTMGRINVPEPSPQMQTRFYALLDEYKDTMAPSPIPAVGWLEQLKKIWNPQPVLRMAYALVLLLLGVTTGYWLKTGSSPSQYEAQMNALSAEVHEMKEMMLLTLIENPSASERLRAVSLTKDIKKVDQRVIDALLSTLNNDENVNVRLVTLDALAQLAHDPRVREGLVQSIVRQESPLMQAAMVDVMVALEEKRSVKPLRQLLKDKELDQSVKGKIEKGIQVLI
jgi:hypothetical protein